MPPRDLPHLATDRHRRFAADVRVNFVEHQHRDFVLVRQHGFQSQHHARHFARRRNGPQRPGRLARIGRKLELNRVQPRGGMAGVGNPQY